MFAREDVPHLIVGSIHICEEPTRILRSELMIVLHAMWERGRSDKWIRHEVAPVCIIKYLTTPLSQYMLRIMINFSLGASYIHPRQPVSHHRSIF